MRYLFLAVCLLLGFSVTTAQVKTPTKPLVFGEIYTGITVGKSAGFALGAELNLQIHSSLISARYGGMYDRKISAISQNSALSAPTILDEFSVLYGYRKIFTNHSFSLSAGLSYTKLVSDPSYDSSNTPVSETYLGVPVEFNVKWFKDKSKQAHPRSFGSSFGLKLFGNIARNSYIGLGITFGLGSHGNM